MFARYAMPVVPFMAVWTGTAMIGVLDRLQALSWPRPAKLTATAALVGRRAGPAARRRRPMGAVARRRDHADAGVEVDPAPDLGRTRRCVSEAHGLELPAERYRYEFAERITDRDPDAVVASGVEWIVLSSDAWRGQRPAASSRPGPPEPYAPFLQRYQVVKAILPAPGVAGPELHILKLAGR